MYSRRSLMMGATVLVVAALLAVTAVQRGSVWAAPAAQATQTELATEAATGTATAAVTGTATDVATQAATATGIITSTQAATPSPTTTRLAPTPAGTQAPLPTNMPARTITVNGVGEASGQPDLAFVQLGVQTDADSAGAALEQNNQQMQAVMDALVEAGVARSDIQTQYVSLYPRYADNTPASGGNGIAGYTAVNSVEARVSDLSAVGDVLDAAVAAGANNIGGIRFSVSDATELRSSARANAMQQARDQAQELAQLAGASLGPVISITENAAGGVPILEAAADAGGAAVPVAPGSQNVQVNLQVTWLLQ